MRYEALVDLFIGGKIVYKGEEIEIDFLSPNHGKCLDEPPKTTIHLPNKGKTKS
jgi:hypothetical protein